MYSFATVLSEWDFSRQNRVTFPGESQLRQSRATQPTVHAGCFSASMIHRTADMDYERSNVRTGVNARDCTRGCTDTLRESALKADSKRKIPCRNGKSNLRQRRAGPMLYQLSYVATPTTYYSQAKILHYPSKFGGQSRTVQPARRLKTVALCPPHAQRASSKKDCLL